jgi:SAM-dependent methyltransferase
MCQDQKMLTPDSLPLKRIEQLAADLASLSLKAGGPKIGKWIEPLMPGIIEPAPDFSPAFIADKLFEFGAHKGSTVLDFGCGSAPHRDLLLSRDMEWHGLDFEGSDDPAAIARTRKVENLSLYSGDKFPFKDGQFDCVWSYQSFEHLPNPDACAAEINRVLKKGGVFAGSVSFLEPFHARSCFSFTPYGWKELCSRHQFTLKKIYPRNDAVSMCFRTYLMMLGFAEKDYDWKQLMGGGGIFFSRPARISKQQQEPGRSTRCAGSDLRAFRFCSDKEPSVKADSPESYCHRTPYLSYGPVPKVKSDDLDFMGGFPRPGSTGFRPL